MSSPEEPSPEPTSDELWFDDGNIILSAEDKQFKVHRGMLSAHSPIFKDMFSLPQSSDSDQDQAVTVQGCSVVELQDSAVELRCVLKALYYGIHACDPNPQMSIATATAFLRLGKKFEIYTLFNEACTRMKECYSLKLPASSSLGRMQRCRLAGRDRLDYQLLNIAREVGITTLLPVALYICSRSATIEEIVDGYTSEGTVYRLDPINRRACIIGRDKYSLLTNTAFEGLLSSKQDRYMSYNSRFPCKSKQCVLWYCITPLPSDPFATWDTGWDSKFCDECVAGLKREYEQCRKKAWNLLPSVFGLGNWEEVVNGETGF